MAPQSYTTATWKFRDEIVHGEGGGIAPRTRSNSCRDVGLASIISGGCTDAINCAAAEADISVGDGVGAGIIQYSKFLLEDVFLTVTCCEGNVVGKCKKKKMMVTGPSLRPVGMVSMTGDVRRWMKRGGVG